jgi:hypothetical protein
VVYVGFRNCSGELEKPHCEWNTLEVVVENKVVHQCVNGKLAIVGTDPFPTEGKVLFQSEGAEVYFRNMHLYPLKQGESKVLLVVVEGDGGSPSGSLQWKKSKASR